MLQEVWLIIPKRTSPYIPTVSIRQNASGGVADPSKKNLTVHIHSLCKIKCFRRYV
jgi:hypothetical protein